jgi:antirestriction protein ArdC
MPSSTESIYARVTQEILESLEQGYLPWNRPWRMDQHRNGSSARPYRGVNVQLLELAAQRRGFTDLRWLTYAQATRLGGHVRRGERGTAIVWFERKERRECSDTHVAEDQPPEWFWLVRSHTMFNVEQTEGTLEALAQPAPRSFSPLEAADNVLGDSGAIIVHHGSRAFYDPASDRITLPPRSAFTSEDGYYSIAFHELVHWTGAPSRLARDHTGRFGDPSYAFEELVAELGASFVAARCGIEHSTQAAAYIQSWMTVLRHDNRALFTAARMATSAADFLVPEASTMAEVSRDAEAA